MTFEILILILKLSTNLTTNTYVQRPIVSYEWVVMILFVVPPALQTKEKVANVPWTFFSYYYYCTNAKIILIEIPEMREREKDQHSHTLIHFWGACCCY